jgi:DUF971 family protein
MSVHPDRIEAGGDAVAIDWNDGMRQTVSARRLRESCPCAACRSTEGAAAIERVLGGLLAVSITDVQLVGDYALSVSFEPDGHRSGIFPFTLLRSLEGDAP